MYTYIHIYIYIYIHIYIYLLTPSLTLCRAGPQAGVAAAALVAACPRLSASAAHVKESDLYKWKEAKTFTRLPTGVETAGAQLLD